MANLAAILVIVGVAVAEENFLFCPANTPVGFKVPQRDICSLPVERYENVTVERVVLRESKGAFRGWRVRVTRAVCVKTGIFKTGRSITYTSSYEPAPSLFYSRTDSGCRYNPGGSKSSNIYDYDCCSISGCVSICKVSEEVWGTWYSKLGVQLYSPVTDLSECKYDTSSCFTKTTAVLFTDIPKQPENVWEYWSADTLAIQEKWLTLVGLKFTYEGTYDSCSGAVLSNFVRVKPVNASCGVKDFSQGTAAASDIQALASSLQAKLQYVVTHVDTALRGLNQVCTASTYFLNFQRVSGALAVTSLLRTLLGDNSIVAYGNNGFYEVLYCYNVTGEVIIDSCSSEGLIYNNFRVNLNASFYMDLEPTSRVLYPAVGEYVPCGQVVRELFVGNSTIYVKTSAGIVKKSMSSYQERDVFATRYYAPIGSVGNLTYDVADYGFTDRGALLVTYFDASRSNSSVNTSGADEEESGLDVGLIVGVIIAGLVLLIIAVASAIVLYCVCRYYCC